MHSFVGPSGTVFNFNGDLSGPVLVTRHEPSAGGAPRFTIPGDDVAAFIRRIQGEYPGALNHEPYLDVKPAAISQALGELHLRIVQLERQVRSLLLVHESKRGEHRCPNAGCLLDAGHSSPCRKLEGAS